MWMELLKEAIKKPSSKKQVADKLGVSRPTISRVMSGTYGADTKNIENKVLDVFGRIQCPHIGADITQAQCKENRTRAAPTSSPREMKFWRACQSCKHNTEQGKANE